MFAPSVWHGPRDARRLALTFDDGPTPGTATLLEVLARYGVRATFFQCGAQVRRNPSVAREVLAAGHETANHTDTHPRLWMRSPRFIRDEIARAQEALDGRPRLFRAPYGVRWPGLRAAQSEFGLLGVMWTTIGRDWALDARGVSARLLDGATPGAIFCLHDGRVLTPSPDISVTVAAVREVVPRLLDDGWRFTTVGDLVGYSGAVCPKTPSGA